VKALVALAIVVAGAVAAFAVYTFGREDKESRRVTPPGERVYTLGQGDTVRMPAAATECLATAEAGFPRLFCTRIGASRYQVIINRDVVQVYDLKDPDTEPFVPTYSVPATTGR
jgi:hypothetical protein